MIRPVATLLATASGMLHESEPRRHHVTTVQPSARFLIRMAWSGSFENEAALADSSLGSSDDYERATDALPTAAASSWRVAARLLALFGWRGVTPRRDTTLCYQWYGGSNDRVGALV